MMIEGDDGNCYCLFADERYLDTPVFLIIICCLIKSRKFPLHCSFVWDAYGLVMMILCVALLKSWMAGSLECIDLSIYLVEQCFRVEGDVSSLRWSQEAPRSSQISVGDQSPNTVAHFQMKEFGKENMNLI
jgi:hypothetical protein